MASIQPSMHTLGGLYLLERTQQEKPRLESLLIDTVPSGIFPFKLVLEVFPILPPLDIQMNLVQKVRSN
jgi:hypothetical protein